MVVLERTAGVTCVAAINHQTKVKNTIITTIARRRGFRVVLFLTSFYTDRVHTHAWGHSVGITTKTAKSIALSVDDVLTAIRGAVFFLCKTFHFSFRRFTRHHCNLLVYSFLCIYLFLFCRFRLTFFYGGSSGRRTHNFSQQVIEFILSINLVIGHQQSSFMKGKKTTTNLSLFIF